MIKLTEGTPLCSTDGARVGNAVVTSIVDDSVHLLTDFGNQVVRTLPEVEEEFYVPEWYIEALHSGMPIPTVRERVHDQLVLLLKFLKDHPPKGNAE